jgi:hypothetical protein
LKDKNNPFLVTAILNREISPEAFANMTSEDMASPERRQENIRMRRSSLSQIVGINDLKPVRVPDEDIPGELVTGEMYHAGQHGFEYQRPV